MFVSSALRLRDVEVAAEASGVGAGDVRKLLTDSVIFDISALNNSAVCADVLEKPLPRRLPYPVSWFELGNARPHPGSANFAVVCTEHDLRRLPGTASNGPDEALAWQVVFLMHTKAANRVLVLAGGGFIFTPDGGLFNRRLFAQHSVPILCDWAFFAPFVEQTAAAVSLLHCKNVVTETYTPDAVTLNRHKRAGNLPPVSYKTLRLTVPETVKSRAPGNGGADPDAKARFHLCRGHFKMLKHPRYKTPGLHWWPAHWRGDPDAGYVEKDYKLTPA